jgi:hypothetical protein
MLLVPVPLYYCSTCVPHHLASSVVAYGEFAVAPYTVAFMAFSCVIPARRQHYRVFTLSAFPGHHLLLAAPSLASPSLSLLLHYIFLFVTLSSGLTCIISTLYLL